VAKRSFPSRQALNPQKTLFPVSPKLVIALSCIASLALLTLPVPACAGDTPTTTLSYARIVRLSYVEGDVQIVRADHSNRWELAAMNMPVEQGFAIGTNEGRAEVEFEHGSMLWLAPNSVVQFTELALSNGGRITRMTVSEGIATVEASLASGDTFEVATPNFSVTPSKNAEFKIGVHGKSAAVTVLNGKVLVGDHGSTQQVAKGLTFVEEDAKTPKTAMVQGPKPDQWDHWVDNRSTAERQGTAEAMVNTNAPFTYGMADLADYGSWNYYPGFGYGWQPWGMMAGWAPFMDGNWMLYPTLGWTWISGEPWGWVPYHFGGWEYSPTFGWMWFPGDYGTWTAAPVEWLGVGKQIGWTPRAVNAPRTGAITTPVVVSTKNLGHEGRNRLFTASELSSRMHALNIHTINFEPAANGKAIPMEASRAAFRPVVVPTSSSLQALRAQLTANSGAKISINSLHQAAASPAAILSFPERSFSAVNAAMMAPRLPSRPPMRAFSTDPRIGEPGYSGNQPPMMPGPSTPSVGSPMPMGTSHPGATTSASGKPR
jgi:hypothetical protein